MARLIQKSGYIKNGTASGYMEYIATRDGVEIIQSTEPVTKKQEQFIQKLLKDFPDAKELFEYGDYKQTPNRGAASAFIATALDTHLHEVESESGYMSYIAQRPRAEKHGGHGLFSEADTTDLKAAKAELEAHNGKVWTFIFSLRREDAERLEYNKAAAWQNLLKQESSAIAEAMRIQTDDFRWYAAYHDEGHHPHVHMMVWSAEPKKGYLTREGTTSTTTPCDRRYEAWANLYILHPQRNGRPTRLTCRLFCWIEARNSLWPDGITGWSATTASPCADRCGMTMPHGRVDAPSASCSNSTTRPTPKR